MSMPASLRELSLNDLEDSPLALDLGMSLGENSAMAFVHVSPNAPNGPNDLDGYELPLLVIGEHSGHVLTYECTR